MLKKYAVKPPKDLTSKFIRKQEARRKREEEEEEEKKQEEEDLKQLVGEMEDGWRQSRLSLLNPHSLGTMSAFGCIEHLVQNSNCLINYHYITRLIKIVLV